MHQRRIPINSSPLRALVLACSDTWVFAWLVLGISISLSVLYEIIRNNDNASPGSELRMLYFNIGYWVLSFILISPRLLHSYNIAKNGVFVLGRLDRSSIYGVAPRTSIRLNVSYAVDGRFYSANASVLGKIPDDGTPILVAIHPDKPNRYRVVPYDFRLTKKTIAQHIESLQQLDRHEAKQPS